MPAPFVTFTYNKQLISVRPERVVAIIASVQKRYREGPGSFAEREIDVPTCLLIIDGESAGSDGAGIHVDGEMKDVMHTILTA